MSSFPEIVFGLALAEWERCWKDAECEACDEFGNPEPVLAIAIVAAILSMLPKVHSLRLTNAIIPPRNVYGMLRNTLGKVYDAGQSNVHAVNRDSRGEGLRQTRPFDHKWISLFARFSKDGSGDLGSRNEEVDQVVSTTLPVQHLETLQLVPDAQ